MYGDEPPNSKPFAMQNASHPQLIERLLDPSRWPGRPEGVELIETHISWVLLAGEEALKIKKPVNLGFLDFSTLERRRHFCEEEVRINRRLAGDYYQGVIPITGPASAPQIDGPGPATEYAVRMRRFPGPGLLSDHLDRMDEELADSLAVQIADFHAQAPVAPPDSDYGTPEAVLRPMAENFRQLRELIQDPEQLETVKRLEEWTLERWRALKHLLQQRRESGMIRECHGDLHLGNITLTQTGPVIFDAIEFDPALRWIDPISDLAFLTMGLEEKGHRRWAWQLLNTYLAQTGDYEGLGLLRFYQVYRAMVRAKVSAIRLEQPALSPEKRRKAQQELIEYLPLGQGFLTPETPILLIMHGVSGSGKSYIAKRLCRELAAVHLRSDVERKRMALSEMNEKRSLNPSIYSSDMTEITYNRLLEQSEMLLRQGLSVCADATFLNRDRRRVFTDMAAARKRSCGILSPYTEESRLRQRILHREEVAKDPSDADEAVLNAQLQNRHPINSGEVSETVQLSQPADAPGWSGLAVEIRQTFASDKPGHNVTEFQISEPAAGY